MAIVRHHHDQLMKEMLATTKGRWSRSQDDTIATSPKIVVPPSAGKAHQGSVKFGRSESAGQAPATGRRENETPLKVQVRDSYPHSVPQERLQSPAQQEPAVKGKQLASSNGAPSTGLTGVKRSPLEVLQSQLTITTAVAVRLGPRPYTPPNQAACEDAYETRPVEFKSTPTSFAAASKPTSKTQTEDNLFTAVPAITSPTGILFGHDRPGSQSKSYANDIQDYTNGVNGPGQLRGNSPSSALARGASLPRAVSKERMANGCLPQSLPEATLLNSPRLSPSYSQREQHVLPRSVSVSATSPGSRHSLPRHNGWSGSAASDKESPLSPQGWSAMSPTYQEQSPRYSVASPVTSSTNAATTKGHIVRGSSWSDSSQGKALQSTPTVTQQKKYTRSISCQTTNLGLPTKEETSKQQNSAPRTASSPPWSQLQRQQCVEVDVQPETEETRVSVSALIEEFNGLSPLSAQEQQSPPQPPDAAYSPRSIAQSLHDEKPTGRQRIATADTRSPTNRPLLGGSGKEPATLAVRNGSYNYNQTAYMTSPPSSIIKDASGALQMQEKQQKQSISNIVTLRDGSSSAARPADTQDGDPVQRRGLPSPRLSFESLNDSRTLGVCAACNEAISANFGGCISMGKKYHISCLVCCRCGKELAEQTFYTIEGNPHCRSCFASTLEKCSSCQEVITGKLLRAAGKVYHLSCFVCTVCKRSLEGQQFVLSPDGDPFCVKDYYETYAPKCDGCYRPIVPEEGEESALQVRVFDRCFHVACCKCELCGKEILSQPSQEAACYPLNGRLVCKTCGLSRTSTGSRALP